MTTNHKPVKVYTEHRIDRKNNTVSVRHIIVSAKTDEVLYQAPTLEIAEEIAKEWNKVGVTWNNDSTLNLG